MSWSTCYNNILPHVFRVCSAPCRGSGVFIGFNDDRSLAAVATAAHAIRAADEGDLPITLRQHRSGKEVTLETAERVIYEDQTRDSAVILFPAEYLDLPEQVLSMPPQGKVHPIGSEVGWVGFPGILATAPCFFSGRISTYLPGERSYLIDLQRAKNIIGRLVFEMLPDDTPRLLGIVCAYLFHVEEGGTSTGLSLMADVSYFHETIKTIRSLDQSGRHGKGDGALPMTSGAAGAIEGEMRPTTA